MDSQKEQPYRKPPENLTHVEKSIHVAREIVRQQLEPEERLIKVLMGKVHASPFLGPVGFLTTPFYCVGMTQINLIAIRLKLTVLKAADVTRIPFEEIQVAKINGRKGNLLHLKWNNAQELKLQVLDTFRDQLGAIIATCGM